MQPYTESVKPLLRSLLELLSRSEDMTEAELFIEVKMLYPTPITRTELHDILVAMEVCRLVSCITDELVGCTVWKSR